MPSTSESLVQITLPAPGRAARLSSTAKPPTQLGEDIHVLPIEPGRYLIYAPLRRSAFIGNGKAVRVVQALSQGTYSPAMDPGAAIATLLERLEMVNAQPAYIPPDGFQGSPQPTTATLLLTTACNLRCTYCYASAGDTPLEFMDFEVARNGIDFVIGNAKRLGASHFEVSYHGGGEPTANWKVLCESALYARRRSEETGLGVRITLTTNGVFSIAKAEWIAEHLHGAGVSFDGIPAMQDAHRKQADGSSSSAQVEQTLRIFDQRQFPYAIRMTVTADQVPRLADSVEYIYANFKATSVMVEPVYQIGRGAGQANAESEEFIESFRESQRRAARFGKSVDFSGARVGIITKHFCGISQDNFCLSAKGNVTACYEAFSESSEWAAKFFYGRPSGRPGEYFIDERVLTELRSQTADNRPFCDGCFARWTCGGDCYHKSLALNGDGDYRGAGRCHVIRELTKDMLLARIAASGGLFWHDRMEQQPNA